MHADGVNAAFVQNLGHLRTDVLIEVEFHLAAVCFARNGKRLAILFISSKYALEIRRII